MIDIRLGDCRDLLKTLGDGSVDAIITDPPYPEITRDYGRMTEVEWHEMMRGVVAEARRVLKPSGSAVFILQPNSRKVGSMRPRPIRISRRIVAPRVDGGVKSSRSFIAAP
jgi:DNA modification methylase